MSDKYPQSFTLTGSSSGALPIASARVSWKINDIPTASLTFVNSGKALPKASDLVTIQLDNTKLLTGYVLGSGMSNTASPFGSSVQPYCTITGSAAMLGTMIGGGRIYAPPVGVIPAAGFLTTKDSIHAGSTTGGETLPALINNDGFTTNLESLKLKGYDIADYVVYVLDKLAKHLNPDFTVNKYVSGTATLIAAVKSLFITSSFEDWLNMLVLSKFTSSNVWETLKELCNALNLHMIPAMDGSAMTIMPAFAWKKTATADLTSDTIFSTAYSSDSFVKNNTYDAVGLVIHQDAKPDGGGTSTTYVSYPVAEGNAQGRKMARILPTSLPPYLNPNMTVDAAHAREGLTATDYDKISKSVPNKKQNNKEVSSLAMRYAQTVFCNLRGASEQIRVRVPWDSFSYVSSVGQVFSITAKMDGSPDTGTYFGMLAAVDLEFAIGPTSGKAEMVLVFSHVRDTQDNDKYAFNTHPFYTNTKSSASADNSTTKAANDNTSSTAASTSTASSSTAGSGGGTKAANILVGNFGGK